MPSNQTQKARVSIRHRRCCGRADIHPGKKEKRRRRGLPDHEAPEGAAWRLYARRRSD
jgi:hypothetical protein